MAEKWQYLGTLREHPEAFGELEIFMREADFELAGWMWCLHCERAYEVGSLRVYNGGRERRLNCAVEGCDGSPHDWTPWHPDEWPRNANPDNPEVPEAFRRYPLYA